MLFCLFLFGLLCFVMCRLTVGITRSNASLIGKTAIVTGANSGIGYQAALNLASRGCRLIMADISDMTESKKNIIQYTNNSNIVAMHLDLSSLASVRKFAKCVIENEKALHILINNAGIGAAKENQTDDGLNTVMQVNYFGPFLLTHLLIDLLKKSAPSRIVFTSSSMAFMSNLSLTNLNGNGSSNLVTSFFEYGNSKLALLIASDIFARKLKNTGVTSNSLHPGLLKTNLLRSFFECYNISIIYSPIRLFMIVFFKSPWEGSQTIVHLAVSKKLENVSGKYFWDCKPFVKPYLAYNKEFCKNIWKYSETYVALNLEEKL